MHERTYGDKYDRDLGIVEIAKIVRKDIRAAVKAGELPKGLKASVRISRYSGGQSLSVSINEIDPDFVIWSPKRVKLDHEDPHGYHDIPYLSEEAKAVEDKIESFYGAYNYDGSETISDYFDVNFYGRVGWNSDLVAADKVRTLAKLAGEPVPTPEPKKKKAKREPSVTEAEVEELLAGLRNDPERHTFAVFELSTSRLKRAGWTGKLKSLVRRGIVEVVEGQTCWNGSKLYRLARTENEKAEDDAEIAKAAELGRAAFESGVKGAPAHDVEVMNLLKGKKIGDGRSIPILKAWRDAWTKANLEAPVPGVSTLAHPDNDPDLKPKPINLDGPVFQAVRTGEC